MARHNFGYAIAQGHHEQHRLGLALGPPWPGPALVAIGPWVPPGEGAFRMELEGGVDLSGLRAEGDEAVQLQATQAGRPLPLPSTALFFLTAEVVSVAGGPADPEAWDRSFGPALASPGDGERLARQRKAQALSADLAALYVEARALRQAGRAEPERLQGLLRSLAAYPEEWLLAREVEELLAPPASLTSAGKPLTLEQP